MSRWYVVQSEEIGDVAVGGTVVGARVGVSVDDGARVGEEVDGGTRVGRTLKVGLISGAFGGGGGVLHAPITSTSKASASQLRAHGLAI